MINVVFYAYSPTATFMEIRHRGGLWGAIMRWCCCQRIVDLNIALPSFRPACSVLTQVYNIFCCPNCARLQYIHMIILARQGTMQHEISFYLITKSCTDLTRWEVKAWSDDIQCTWYKRYCGDGHHLPDQMRSQWLIVTKSARCLLSRYTHCSPTWPAVERSPCRLPVPGAHCGENPTSAHRCLETWIPMHHSIFPSCAMHFFQHCILKCRDVLQRLGRSSLADLSAALGRTRSSDSVRQMAPTAPSSFLPFSPQTIAIRNCKWKNTDRCLAQMERHTHFT